MTSNIMPTAEAHQHDQPTFSFVYTQMYDTYQVCWRLLISANVKTYFRMTRVYR